MINISSNGDPENAEHGLYNLTYLLGSKDTLTIAEDLAYASILQAVQIETTLRTLIYSIRIKELECEIEKAEEGDSQKNPTTEEH